MKIVSPNDVNPDCTPESGVTYGEVNRYASSTGDDSGKMVDTFNGNEGQADEINTNTSCATLSMTPNTFDSTYSDVTVYTNSGTGYAVTLQSAENTSPNLVNTSDSTQYIEAGALTEQDGTGEQAGQKVVPGGQNKWAYKTNNGIITDWTAATTSPVAIKAYDTTTSGGDTTRVTYGISAGSNPTGKYTTTLTYTATMFDGANPYIDYMQDFLAADYASDPVNTKYTLLDSRDRREYTAAKLADGNIWMTEDLKLGGDSAVTLTPSDSDVSSNYILPAENTGAWCEANSDACGNQSLMIKTGAPNGYLYNWYAATAGTGTYGMTSGNATASICPKGWKLPTENQLVALDQAYGGDGTNRTDIAQVDKFLSSPLNFDYTGYRYVDSVYDPSGSAAYWTRTAHSSGSKAYRLMLRSNGIFYPQNENARYVGYAVRCVADETTLSDITNMQDMTPAVVANTAVGASKTLTDTRGGSYTVTKLADNNIWMTQDLKLGGSSALTLTPADSDVSENYTLPAENTGTWCTDTSAACINQSLMIKTGAPNGYLYSWNAATAGTGTYELSNGEVATASICPKGWKLPTGGTNGNFANLDIAYGGSGENRSDATQRAKFMSSPLNFNYTGEMVGDRIYSVSNGSRWWSRTVSSEPHAAHTIIIGADGTFNPQHYNKGFIGSAIRCVAAS